MGVSLYLESGNIAHMIDVPFDVNFLKLTFFVFFSVFLGLNPWHMEVPRLGLNQSCSCWPILQPQQRGILNPLGKVRDQIRVLMDTSRVCYH